jgi:hypothetical protein
MCASVDKAAVIISTGIFIIARYGGVDTTDSSFAAISSTNVGIITSDLGIYASSIAIAGISRTAVVIIAVNSLMHTSS